MLTSDDFPQIERDLHAPAADCGAVALGEFSPEEAERMGAFRDPAAAADLADPAHSECGDGPSRGVSAEA